MSALISKMVIFVVFMVIGYWLARSGKADKGFTKAASFLVMNVFLSATVLNSVIVTETELSGGQVAFAMLVLSLSILLGMVVAAVATRLVPLDKDQAPVFELATGIPNTMFIALPVVESVCGSMGVFYCSLSCIPFNVFLYTYGVWRLKSGREGGLRIKEIFSIPLLATFLALIIFLFKIPVPGIIRSLLSAAAGATMPMSMILIGASLGSVSLLAAFKDWRLYVSGFARLIVAPLLVYFICHLFITDPVLLLSSTLVAAAPGAVVITVLSIQYGRDEVFSSEAILHSTVVAMVTMPLLVYFLM